MDQFIPVDVYIPGCPPRPENLIDAVRLIQDQVGSREVQQMIDEATGVPSLPRLEHMQALRAERARQQEVSS